MPLWQPPLAVYRRGSDLRLPAPELGPAPLSGLAGLPDVGGLDGFEGLAVDLLGPYIDFLF